MGKDIYDNRHSIYCYDGSDVLINKLDIKDKALLQKYEAKIVAAKLLALRKKGIIGNFDIEHLKIFINIYLKMFTLLQEILEQRILQKVYLDLQNGIYIETELTNLMNKLKSENFLADFDKNNLAEKLAFYLSELNVLHPFREGNGRTTREFIRELALKNDYILNLKKVNPKDFLNASIKFYSRYYRFN